MERVYIPINENNIHWFMCVVNFKDANVYVLDSLPSLSKSKVQNEKVLRVLEYLDDVIQHLGNNGSVMKAHKLPIKRLKWLPVQESGSDVVCTLPSTLIWSNLKRKKPLRYKISLFIYLTVTIRLDHSLFLIFGYFVKCS
ncbi:hypothetical protein RHGRI_008087 [Rhododendron griersonianum]|uniref:Ubiquitin-like protease family profile domain-containing protein n=1 Tax=Rhododendron griersonianum TaxID=479676 RepID=A0AAV6L060_9ERIC|nr:hypothetical protein RHGRI_008087 [Rhododendron griersonianum]